jgi:hypothetical protein
MHRVFSRQRQTGAVIVTVSLVLLFLLGFMGIALDFGHLFVVKTELQTAMDSCALAAAQELDGGVNALDRATSAGETAGNSNKVNFQGQPAGIVNAEITFSNTLLGTYRDALTPLPNPRYAKCTHTKSGMAPWLLQAMGAFTGTASFKATQGVAALAVASRASAQSACAIPVQITPKAGGAAPNYGFAPGEWIPSLYDESNNNTVPTPGFFGWANLDGSTNATATKDELLGTGFCNLRTGDTVGTSGKKFSASVEWNARFGLYKGGANPDINSATPDTTGYAYTAVNWPAQSNASTDFLAKRATNRSYGDTVDTVNAGDAITGLNIKGGYKSADMGTYALGAQALATHGGDRRLVMGPVVVGGLIADWACILMLHPIDAPKRTVYLEYVGNASNPSSPCTSAGLAGGTNGPLVPVLVQ